MNFSEYAKTYRPFVEAALEKYLPDEGMQPTTIHRAMRYSALGGGKRLRALLAIAGCQAVGGDIRQVEPLVAALEMIHAYSLVHDDLPCMDDDDYRRGKLTCHKVFGEGLAVLTGDALLTQGFYLISRLADVGVDGDTITRVLAELGQACGTDGLIGGQVVDLESEGKEVSRSTLEYIHTRKTGALFKTSIRCGAIIGGATDDQLDIIDTYADNFGLAFQITDDILDVVGDEAKLGKAVGSDERHIKATYVSILGLEQAKQRAQGAIEAAKEAIVTLEGNTDALVSLAEFVIARDH